MQTAMKAEKPRKQAISGRFWAGRTYRGRIKDDHKIDQACGTGGMLSTMYNYVKHLNPDADVRLFGQELMGQTYAIGLAEMLIKGQNADNFRHEDTFKKDCFSDQKMRFVIENPPFGSPWGGKDAKAGQEEAVKKEYSKTPSRWGAGLPGSGDSQMLFLQSAVAKMDDRVGRAAIIFDSKSLSAVQKKDELAKVLKTGYDENLDILCVCNETEEGQAHQIYVNLDEDNPLSVGNRYMLCYTGYNRAIHDTHASLYPKTALILELPTRDMLNNIFNKRVIGGLIFNRYLSNAIILHKTVLEGYIKGEKPLPPNFVDTPMPYPLEYPHDITPEMMGLMHQLEKAMDKDPDGFKKFMAKMAKEQNNKK